MGTDNEEGKKRGKQRLPGIINHVLWKRITNCERDLLRTQVFASTNKSEAAGGGALDAGRPVPNRVQEASWHLTHSHRQTMAGEPLEATVRSHNIVRSFDCSMSDPLRPLYSGNGAVTQQRQHHIELGAVDVGSMGLGTTETEKLLLSLSPSDSAMQHSEYRAAPNSYAESSPETVHLQSMGGGRLIALDLRICEATPSPGTTELWSRTLGPEVRGTGSWHWQKVWKNHGPQQGGNAGLPPPPASASFFSQAHTAHRQQLEYFNLHQLA